MLQYLRIACKLCYYLGLAFFTYLMALITLQYIPLNFEVSFLVLKDELVNKLHYQIAFFAHVYTSILVLILGIPQFSLWLRNKFKLLHRNIGKAYIFLILFISAPSGLIMAFYANGDGFTKTSFILQSILWFVFTWIAFKSALKKSWISHENFILRSYALTLSAISLRLFKWIIVSVWELPPMDTYKIVAWAGWLVNLLIVEFYIYWKSQQRK
ncbi:MAG: DUF2306 domain-containing protein [Crocinitomicaceae bacterium]|nr:DUF2306 domain-containing protein [Crocinitomicaceae bacterium]